MESDVKTSITKLEAHNLWMKSVGKDKKRVVVNEILQSCSIAFDINEEKDLKRVSDIIRRRLERLVNAVHYKKWSQLNKEDIFLDVQTEFPNLPRAEGYDKATLHTICFT